MNIVPPGDHLRDALATAPDGATLWLEAGEHIAGCALARSVTLRPAPASPPTSPDTSGAEAEAQAVTLVPSDDGGPVVWIDADELDVTLVGLHLAKGSGEAGGGLSLRGFSTVTAESCRISDCRAADGAGDAVWVDAGTLRLQGCNIEGMPDRPGAVVVATGLAALAVAGGVLSGHGTAVLRLRDGCEAEITGAKLHNRSERAAITVAGTSTRRPAVRVIDSQLIGVPSLALRATYPGKVQVGDSVLASPAEGVYRPLGGVVVRDRVASDA